MAKKLQLRRGTTSQHSSFTGDVGECTVDTDKDTLVVHDNSTQGGFPLARENLSNVTAIPSAITATTQAASDDSTKIATTAYVTNAIGNISTTSISSGTSDVTVTNNAQTTVTANNTEVAEFGTTGIVFNDTGADRDFRVESDGNANMLFLDGGSNRVGIGTNAPNTTFDVRGDVGVQNNSSGSIHSLNQTGSVIFNEQGAPQDFRVESDTNANMLLVDGSANRVGIGTNSPTVPLDIAGDTRVTDSGNTIHSFANTGDVVLNEGGASADFRVESDTRTHMLFVDGSANRIGINNNSPAEVLDVNGNIRVEGGVDIQGGASLELQNSNNNQSVQLNAENTTESYTARLPPVAPDNNGEVMAVASGTTTAVLEWTKPWRVPVQSAAPTGAVQGDLWWDTDDARLYIYISDTNIVNEAAWVAASPV